MHIKINQGRSLHVCTRTSQLLRMMIATINNDDLKKGLLISSFTLPSQNMFSANYHLYYSSTNLIHIFYTVMF